jgi:hypothetical protein
MEPVSSACQIVDAYDKRENMHYNHGLPRELKLVSIDVVQGSTGAEHSE